MTDLPRTADVVVVGGGVHGASVAYHLAKKRAGRVLLVERKFLAAGPTGRSTAVVRRHYAHDYLTASAERSAEVYRHWDAIIGGDCGFREVGWVQLAGPQDRALMERTVGRARQIGAQVQMISVDDVKALIPGMVVDGVGAVAYEAHSGFADPAMTTAAFAERARELGAQIALSVEVTGIKTAGGKVTGIATANRDVGAPVVVVCAGVWANRLTAPLGVEIPIDPRRHQMGIYQRPPDFPRHPVVYDLILGTYGRPDHGDLAIFGIDAYGESVDPDRFNEGADFDEIALTTEAITQRFPAMLRGISRGGYAGVFDLTPDSQPALGPVAEYAGLYLDCAWSGHGFKHAPMTGHVISELILTGHYPEGLDASEFDVARFRRGKLIGGYAAYSPPKYGAEAGHVGTLDVQPSRPS